MGQVRIYMLAKKMYNLATWVEWRGWRNVGKSCSLGKWHPSLLLEHFKIFDDMVERTERRSA